MAIGKQSANSSHHCKMSICLFVVVMLDTVPTLLLSTATYNLFEVFWFSIALRRQVFRNSICVYLLNTILFELRCLGW